MARARTPREPAKTLERSAKPRATRTSDELTARLARDLRVLCETPACKRALAAVLAKVRSAHDDDGDTLVVMLSGGATITCYPPERRNVSSFPRSWQKLMKAFGNLAYECKLRGKPATTWFNGANGSRIDRRLLQERVPELAKQLKPHQVPIERILNLEGTHTWVIAHPTETTRRGEPRLYPLTERGLGEPYPDTFGVPGLFLRLMARDLARVELID